MTANMDKFNSLEEFVEQLPPDLMEEVTKKTHAEVMRLPFFRDKTIEFQNLVVHELKPVNIPSEEILY